MKTHSISKFKPPATKSKINTNVEMSSGNRKIFDDMLKKTLKKTLVSPLNFNLQDGIEENLTGVGEENSAVTTNPWIIATMVAVAILVEILAFGFGDQIEDFARDNCPLCNGDVVDQTKDLVIQYIFINFQQSIF